VLVVVDAVPRVAVDPVAVVHVVLVGDRLVTAPLAVDVHVARMREVERIERRRDLVHVVCLQVMDVPVMEVVEMVAVGDGRMAAPRVVVVIVVGMRLVRMGLRRSGRSAHPSMVAQVPGAWGVRSSP